MLKLPVTETLFVVLLNVNPDDADNSPPSLKITCVSTKIQNTLFAVSKGHKSYFYYQN